MKNGYIISRKTKKGIKHYFYNDKKVVDEKTGKIRFTKKPIIGIESPPVGTSLKEANYMLMKWKKSKQTIDRVKMIDTTAEWMETHYKRKRRGEISSTSINHFLNYNKIIDNFFSTYYVDQITIDEFDEFVDAHLHYSDSHLNAIAYELYSRLEYCFVKKYTNERFLRKSVNRPMERNKDFYVPTMDEIQIIRKYGTLKLQLYIDFLITTGIRTQEFFMIDRRRDIDLEAGMMYIGERDAHGRKLRKNKQNKPSRDIPIFNQTISTIKKLLELVEGPGICPYGFSKTKTPTDAATNEIRRVAQLAKKNGENVFHFTAKSIRKTFANYMIEKGINKALLAKYMGHAESTQVSHYLSIPSSNLNDFSNIKNLMPSFIQ